MYSDLRNKQEVTRKKYFKIIAFKDEAFAGPILTEGENNALGGGGRGVKGHVVSPRVRDGRTETEAVEVDVTVHACLILK